MAKFSVAIIHTENQVFTIEAQNIEAQNSSEAVDKLSNAWDNGVIQLDNPDTCDTDFSIFERADENARAVL